MKRDLNSKEFLDKVLERIDISPTQYKTAVSHYNAVGEYLNRNGVSESVYPQGSFALGTVVRPLKESDEVEFDIDLVCESDLGKLETTPKEVKNNVKEALETSELYKKLLDPEEKRRCWTLNYAEKDGVGFHIDILPCVHEQDDIIQEIQRQGTSLALAQTAISITDFDEESDAYDWTYGNAKGLANWFNAINDPYLNKVSAEQKRQLFEKGVFATVEEVPDMLLRSSLQRAIQILKRHRDCRFIGAKNEKDKPISMIITVLSAHIANNCRMYDASTFELLNVVVDELTSYAKLLDGENTSFEGVGSLVIRDKGEWYIANPTNPFENYAERWTENNNAKAKAFFEWIKWLKEDILVPMSGNDSGKAFEAFSRGFGRNIIKDIYKDLGLVTISAPTILTSTNMPKPYGWKI